MGRRSVGTWMAVGGALLALVACGGAEQDARSTTTPTSPTVASTTTGPAGPDGSDPWTGPTVLIDTDLSLWWDDATALGAANVLVQRGELRILGILSDVPNARAVAAIDAINTAYGNPDLPIGAVAGSAADTFEHGYTDALLARLAHSVEHSDDVPEAVELARRLLAAAPDRSVTIVAIGSYTNLAGLLASEGDDASPLDGPGLLRAKVTKLVLMDGLFPTGGPPLTNQKIDLEAAEAVVTGDWPTPIAWVDGFTGIATVVGGTLCADAPAEHPMRIVYEALFSCDPPTEGSWDGPALLYAVGDLDSAFDELGRGGAAVLNESGGLRWQESSERPDDVYVHVADQEALNARLDALLLAQ